MKILNELKLKAKNKNAIIVLPEADVDERVMNAALEIEKQGLCNLIVFGKANNYDAALQNSNRVEIIEINKSSLYQTLANELYELRKHKGITKQDALKLIANPMYFAMMLVHIGKADGVVAGATYSTADVLRPALQIVKTKPGKKIVTGGMLMLKDRANPLFFGDVSLVEQPTSEQLAEIAIASAEFMQKVVAVEPKVAMLSFSTRGSAKHEMVDKVRNATMLAQNKGFLVDGEMQVDSALDLATAKKKGITSEVGGNANVLIFPDLDAGNIGYKLVARLGGYQAIGPIMLNFNKPVNDLSRGCTVEEIINTVVITKLLI